MRGIVALVSDSLKCQGKLLDKTKVLLYDI